MFLGSPSYNETEGKVQRWVTFNIFVTETDKGKYCHKGISTPLISIASILIPVIHLMKLKFKEW